MAALIYGMLPGERIASVLPRLRQFVAENWICVVRSIDSIRDPEDLAYCLTSHGLPSNSDDGNVFVSGATLQKAVATGVLTGFDEVWVFLEAPPTECLDEVPSATSETTDFANGVPKELRQAIARTHCLLVLGDGSGLNFATTVERIARRLTRDVV